MEKEFLHFLLVNVSKYDYYLEFRLYKLIKLCAIKYTTEFNERQTWHSCQLQAFRLIFQKNVKFRLWIVANTIGRKRSIKVFLEETTISLFVTRMSTLLVIAFY